MLLALRWNWDSGLCGPGRPSNLEIVLFETVGILQAANRILSFHYFPFV